MKNMGKPANANMMKYGIRKAPVNKYRHLVMGYDSNRPMPFGLDSHKLMGWGDMSTQFTQK